MNHPTPGLRRLFNRSHSPVRVEVIVPAGDALDVSDDVAGQLTAASGAFGPEPSAAPAAEPTPEPAAEAAEPEAKPAPKTRSRRKS